jgi:tetratricopeptide (TPR) repeat protein
LSIPSSKRPWEGARRITVSRHRRDLLVLFVVILAGALFRLAYFTELRHDPVYAHPNLDAELHDYWAWGLAGGDWRVPSDKNDPDIQTTPYFRPPGYAYFLSLVYRAGGHQPAAPRLAQFGLGLLSAFLGFLLGRRFAGPTVGLVLAGFLSLYWGFVHFEGELLDPPVVGTLTLSLLLALSGAADRPGFARGTVAGGLLGLFALFRPNILLFLPVCLGWLVWRTHRGQGLRRSGPVAAGLLLGAALAIAPATLRNARVSGELVMISSNGGVNLLIGNNPEADGVNAVMPGVKDLTGAGGWNCFDYVRIVEALSHKLGRPIPHSEASRIWAREAMAYIRQEPGHFLALTAKRAALFWGPFELGDRDAGLARRASPVLRAIPLNFSIMLAFAALGVLSLVSAGKQREPLALLAALFVLTYFASFLPLFFSARYRMPMLPALFLFAALGVVDLARLFRAGETQRAWVWAGVAAAVFAVGSLNLAGARPRVEDWHYQRANAFRLAGNDEEAMIEYARALRANPGHLKARNDRALLLARHGRSADAERELRLVLETRPADLDARFNLAQLLVVSGRKAEAVAEYRRVLAIDPYEFHAHLSLGTLLLEGGRPEEGLGHYRTAEAIRPQDPLVQFVLGRGLLALGKTTEALRHLREAVRLDPTDPAKRRTLARAEERAG